MLKKFLFLVFMGTSVSAFATDTAVREYQENEVQFCSYNKEWRCNLYDKPITGVLKIKNSKGGIYSTTEYKFGKEDGAIKYYYEDGTLQMEAYAKDGKPEGSSKYYYENGKIYQEENYINGKRNGIFKTYNEDGGLASEVLFKDDVMEFTKRYNENGRLITEMLFKGGAPENLKEYYEDGKLDKEVKFKDWQAVSGVLYDPQGEKMEMTKDYLKSYTEFASFLLFMTGRNKI